MPIASTRLLATLLTAGALTGPAFAAENDAASPAPIANGSRPIAGATEPGKAATQAVTDPSAVPPSERAPGADTRPGNTQAAPPAASR